MDSTDKTNNENEEKVKRRFVARSLTDIQRIKLEKLMSNPVQTYFIYIFVENAQYTFQI